MIFFHRIKTSALDILDTDDHSNENGMQKAAPGTYVPGAVFCVDSVQNL